MLKHVMLQKDNMFKMLKHVMLQSEIWNSLSRVLEMPTRPKKCTFSLRNKAMWSSFSQRCILRSFNRIQHFAGFLSQLFSLSYQLISCMTLPSRDTKASAQVQLSILQLNISQLPSIPLVMCGPEGLTGHFSGWGMCAHAQKDVAKQRYLPTHLSVKCKHTGHV